MGTPFESSFKGFNSASAYGSWYQTIHSFSNVKPKVTNSKLTVTINAESNDGKGYIEETQISLQIYKNGGWEEFVNDIVVSVVDESDLRGF